MPALDFLLAHPRKITFGWLHFFGSAVGQTFFVSLFVASVTAQFGWSERTFAGLYSGVTLASAVALPFVGTLVDRHRARYVSTATALALALALLTLALTQDVLVFAVALFVARLGGQGVLPLIGSTVIGRFFDTSRGKALSATVIGTALSEIVLPPLVVWGMQRAGYETVWVVAAGFMALVFVPLMWWLVPRRDPFQKAEALADPRAGVVPQGATVLPGARAVLPKGVEAQRSWTRTEVLRDPKFWLVVPAFVLTPFVLTGIIFNQALVAELRGYTATWMAFGISAYGLARGAMTLFGGGLIDRLSAKRLVRFVAAPMLLGLVCLLVIEGEAAVPAFFILAGATAGSESVLWPALWAERYGPAHLGSIKSATRVLMVLMTAVAPVLFSWLLGFGLGLLLVVLLGYAAVAVGLVWSRAIVD